MRGTGNKPILVLLAVAFAAWGVCGLAQAQTPGSLALDMTANVECYTPGGFVDVSVTFTNPADGEVLTSLGLEVKVPDVLTYDSDVSGTIPDGAPDPGSTGTLNWFTFTKAKFPAPGTSKEFTFRLAVAASATGPAIIEGIGIYFTSGDELRTNEVEITLCGAPVNQCPVAESVDAALDPCAPSISGPLPASDPDDDPLTFSIVTPPQNGILDATSDGMITYTPNPGFVGIDCFEFKANDGQCDSNVARICLTVPECIPQCIPPQAEAQSVTTPENTALPITLTATDTSDGLPTFEILSGPSNGTLSGTPPDLVYQPNDDFIGTDSFMFLARSPLGCAGEPATVTIEVPCLAPVVADQAVTTDEDKSVEILLNAEHSGTNLSQGPLSSAGGPRVVFLGMSQRLDLSFEVLSQPTHGTLTGDAPALTYAPDADYCGPDSFTFRALSGTCASSTATVNITVTCVNDCPVANAGPDQNALVDAVVTLDGSASSDIDGDTITYLWSFLSVPSGSAAALDDATAVKPTFAPDLAGDYVVQLVVNDGQCDSEPDTVVVHVEPGPVEPPLEISQAVTPEGCVEPGSTIQVCVTFTNPAGGGVITSLGLQEMVGDKLSYGEYISGPSPTVQPDPGAIGTLEFAWISGFPIPGGDPITFCFTLIVASDAEGVLDISGVAPYFTSGDQLESNAVGSIVEICVPPCPRDPVAEAGDDQVVDLGNDVALNGSMSYDPDDPPLPLSYAWTFVSLPGCSALTNGDIVNSNAPEAMFTPDCEGAYVLQLQVCKEIGPNQCQLPEVLCATDNVTITVNPIQECFEFTDVSTLMQVATADQKTTLDRMTRTLVSTATVTITNASSVTVAAPVQAVIPISAPGVDMPDATGLTGGGDFYFDLGVVQLAPGESASVALKFVYPYSTRFTYQVQVWGNIPVPCP